MYRAGLPFWKIFAKLFGKVRFRVTVNYDAEAKVFVATSPDLKGFVVEAATMDQLVNEAHDVAAMLVEQELHASNTVVEPVYNNVGPTVLHP